MYTAVLGGKAEIKTFKGAVNVNIQKGTQTGAELTLKGLGMPVYRKNEKKGNVMAFNERLAARVRQLLGTHRKVVERQMMGALTFMVNDKMCVCVLKDDLMARIDPERHDDALRRKGCRKMDFTGRPMKGFVFVGPEGTGSKRNLESWIALALEFNKKAKPSRKKSPRRLKSENHMSKR